MRKWLFRLQCVIGIVAVAALSVEGWWRLSVALLSLALAIVAMILEESCGKK